MTRRLIWLVLSGLLLASAANVVRRDGWTILALLALVAVAGVIAPLVTWLTAAKALTHSDPEAAEVLAALRKELTR